MIDYFSSTNKLKIKTEIPSQKQIDNKTEFDDSTIREWQKYLIQNSHVRVQRISKLIPEINNQIRIRKKLNSEQKIERIKSHPM
jgi:hypothetical protein